MTIFAASMENLSLYQTIILSMALVGTYVRFNLLVNKLELKIGMLEEQHRDMKKEHNSQMSAINDSISELLKSVKHIELTLAKKQIS